MSCAPTTRSAAWHRRWSIARSSYSARKSSLDFLEVRAQLPVTATTAYLNAGTAGPLPPCAAEATEAAMRRELDHGRASPSGFPDYPPLVQDTRRRLGDLIGADAEDMALTHSTTEGINTIVWGTAPGPVSRF